VVCRYRERRAYGGGRSGWCVGTGKRCRRVVDGPPQRFRGSVARSGSASRRGFVVRLRRRGVGVLTGTEARPEGRAYVYDQVRVPLVIFLHDPQPGVRSGHAPPSTAPPSGGCLPRSRDDCVAHDVHRRSQTLAGSARARAHRGRRGPSSPSRSPDCRILPDAGSRPPAAVQRRDAPRNDRQRIQGADLSPRPSSRAES